MTKDECEKQSFSHSNRTRSHNGFYCRDCQNFFDKDSFTYRRYELSNSYWMVVHNIGVDCYKNNTPPPKEIKIFKNKLENAAHVDEEQLNELLLEVKQFIVRYGKNKDSATIRIGYNEEKEIKE